MPYWNTQYINYISQSCSILKHHLILVVSLLIGVRLGDYGVSQVRILVTHILDVVCCIFLRFFDLFNPSMSIIIIAQVDQILRTITIHVIHQDKRCFNCPWTPSPITLLVWLGWPPGLAFSTAFPPDFDIYTPTRPFIYLFLPEISSRVPRFTVNLHNRSSSFFSWGFDIYDPAMP